MAGATNTPPNLGQVRRKNGRFASAKRMRNVDGRPWPHEEGCICAYCQQGIAPGGGKHGEGCVCTGCKPHPEGCRCSVHNYDPVICTYEDPVTHQVCGKVIHGVRALGAHTAFVHKARRKMATEVRVTMTPTGLGNLRKVLADPQRRALVDLSALPKFAQALTLVPNSTYKVRRKAAKRILAEAQAQPDAMIPMWVELPGSIVEVVMELALATDVAPKTVLAAIACYGIESIAKELRSWRAMSRVTLPRYAQAIEGDPIPGQDGYAVRRTPPLLPRSS